MRWINLWELYNPNLYYKTIRRLIESTLWTTKKELPKICIIKQLYWLRLEMGMLFQTQIKCIKIPMSHKILIKWIVYRMILIQMMLIWNKCLFKIFKRKIFSRKIKIIWNKLLLRMQMMLINCHLFLKSYLIMLRSTKKILEDKNLSWTDRIMSKPWKDNKVNKIQWI